MLECNYSLRDMSFICDFLQRVVYFILAILLAFVMVLQFRDQFLAILLALFHVFLNVVCSCFTHDGFEYTRNASRTIILINVLSASILPYISLDPDFDEYTFCAHGFEQLRRCVFDLSCGFQHDWILRTDIVHDSRRFQCNNHEPCVGCKVN